MITIIQVSIIVFIHEQTRFWQLCIMTAPFLKIITLPVHFKCSENLNITSSQHFLRLKSKLCETLWWKWFWRQIWGYTTQFSRIFKLGYLKRQIEHQRKKMYCQRYLFQLKWLTFLIVHAQIISMQNEQKTLHANFTDKAICKSN